MNIRRLDSGRYQARIYDKFLEKYISFTADSKKEAEHKARMYDIGQAPAMRFEDALDLFLDSRSEILSPPTIKNYKAYSVNHLTPFKNRYIDDITDAMIQSFVNDFAKTHSPKTTKNIYSFICAVIRSQKPSKSFNVLLPKKTRNEMEMPSDADVKRLLEVSKGRKIHLVFELAIFCCMRRGEISALRQEDVHDSYISVNHSMVKKDGEWILKTPKTYASYRDIPCAQFLIDELKAGVPNMTPSQISKDWAEIKRKLNLPFTFHSLRHYSASKLLTITGSVLDTEAIGGWQHGSKTLQTVYAYNIREQFTESQKKWVNFTDNF